ncbi:hypothetical protein ACIQMJ_28000 [Actinosynnema sp. NPDC091369]
MGGDSAYTGGFDSLDLFGADHRPAGHRRESRTRELADDVPHEVEHRAEAARKGHLPDLPLGDAAREALADRRFAPEDEQATTSVTALGYATLPTARRGDTGSAVTGPARPGGVGAGPASPQQ